LIGFDIDYDRILTLNYFKNFYNFLNKIKLNLP